MKRRNGGPAFPTTASNIQGSGGMTIRDWFAGQALAGPLSGSFSSGGAAVYQELAQESGCHETDIMAKAAYQIADAMLKEREK